MSASSDHPGQAMHDLIRRLYPICRSITGDGVRQTLRILQDQVPLQVHEVPTGTPVFDWTVPNEWNLREAYIADSTGRRIVDFANHSLHVVSYSTPVRARMRLAELKKHLHTLPDRPDAIPYRTSYYAPSWGFCLSQRQLESLVEDDYEVVIDSTLAPGHLTYGELLIPGQRREEVLLSAHVCHPSLANDNLSGIALLTFLARHFQANPLRHSLRVLLIPGTIGSITWLARNTENARRIRHGMIASCVGDGGAFTYKRSRRGDAVIDRAAEQALKESGKAHSIIEFSPYGYDERQFCSPGFDLPVGLLMRSQYGTFPQYHSSDDNLDFVTPAALGGSFEMARSILTIADRNGTYVNLNPYCEPQLGRRGLYGMVGGHTSPKQFELAMLWVLNQSDGGNDLLGIARRSGLAFELIAEAAEALAKHGLLREAIG